MSVEAVRDVTLGLGTNGLMGKMGESTPANRPPVLTSGEEAVRMTPGAVDRDNGVPDRLLCLESWLVPMSWVGCMGEGTPENVESWRD